ncbi:MAG: hypothetical protein U1E38_02425 [Rhodospirillales bacterium]
MLNGMLYVLKPVASGDTCRRPAAAQHVPAICVWAWDEPWSASITSSIGASASSRAEASSTAAVIDSQAFARRKGAHIDPVGTMRKKIKGVKYHILVDTLNAAERGGSPRRYPGPRRRPARQEDQALFLFIRVIFADGGYQALLRDCGGQTGDWQPASSNLIRPRASSCCQNAGWSSVRSHG